MAKAELECNITESFDKFCDLTHTEMTKAVKRALIAGGKELQRVTKNNVVGGLATRGNKHYYDGKLKVYSDNIEDAVRLGRMEGDFNSELVQPVHVYGTRASESGTYRLRFLEKGTKDRIAYRLKGKPLKKPRKLGKIEGRWFFKSAQNAVFPNLQSIYTKELQKTINKLNQSKI